MFESTYSNKKVLITGHTGFKGAWLTLWLHRMGAHVFGISIDIPTQPSLFEVLGLESKIEHKIADIRDEKRMKELFSEYQPDFVFHMAAQPIVSMAYEDPMDTISVNVLGTASVLNACRVLQNPCQVIVVTSDKCYKNVEWDWGYRETDILGGNDIYSSSKSCTEIITSSFIYSYLDTSEINVTTARSGNVIGGGDWARDRIVPDCIRAWCNEKKVTLRRPDSVRPWQHVLEPLAGYLRLGSVMSKQIEIDGEAFNFGPATNEEHSVYELVSSLSDHWGYKDSNEACKIFSDVNFKEANYLKLNCDKAYVQLNWKPVLSFHETMELTGNWYREFYSKTEDMLQITNRQIDLYESNLKATFAGIWE